MTAPVQAPTKLEINFKTTKALVLFCQRNCSPAPTR